jgi:hypothetical protein
MIKQIKNNIKKVNAACIIILTIYIWTIPPEGIVLFFLSESTQNKTNDEKAKSNCCFSIYGRRSLCPAEYECC